MPGQESEHLTAFLKEKYVYKALILIGKLIQRHVFTFSDFQVCYEVKITEEIKWEDLSKLAERNRQDAKRNQKRDRDKRGRRGDDRKSEKPADKKEKEKAEEKTEEKKETSENADKENDAAEVTNADSTENKEDQGEKKDEEKVAEKDEEKMETTAEGDEKPTEETPMETETAPTTDDAKKSDTDDVEKKNEDEGKDGEKKTTEEEKKEPEEEIPIHLVRVGWSLLTSSLQLGEDKFSYAYESTGKFVNDKQFIDYGRSFAVGDVVGAYLVSYIIGDLFLEIPLSISQWHLDFRHELLLEIQIIMDFEEKYQKIFKVRLNRTQFVENDKIMS